MPKIVARPWLLRMDNGSMLRARRECMSASSVRPMTARYEAIARCGIAGRVARLGPVAPTDRWAAFDGAAVFCLPSENENFGTVVPESLARGCPVVVSEGVAAGRYAIEAKAGRTVPRTIDAITSALDAELADSAGRAARGASGRALVRRELSWEGVAERLGRLYSEVKKRTARPSFQRA